MEKDPSTGKHINNWRISPNSKTGMLEVLQTRSMMTRLTVPGSYNSGGPDQTPSEPLTPNRWKSNECESGGGEGKREGRVQRDECPIRTGPGQLCMQCRLRTIDGRPLRRAHESQAMICEEFHLEHHLREKEKDGSCRGGWAGIRVWLMCVAVVVYVFIHLYLVFF